MDDRRIRASWARLRRLQRQLREAIVVVEQCLQPLVTGPDDFSEDSEVSLWSDSDSDARRWHGTNVIRRARVASKAVQRARDALSMIPFDLEAAAIALGAPRRNTAAQFQAMVEQTERWLAQNDERVRRLDSALERYKLCLIARDNAYSVLWAELMTEDRRRPMPRFTARRRIPLILRRRRASNAATLWTERRVAAVLQSPAFGMASP